MSEDKPKYTISDFTEAGIHQFVQDIYSVSSRIISVETGEIEKTEVYDHTGDIGQLLTNGMKQVAIGLIK